MKKFSTEYERLIQEGKAKNNEDDTRKILDDMGLNKTKDYSLGYNKGRVEIMFDDRDSMMEFVAQGMYNGKIKDSDVDEKKLIVLLP